MNSHPLAGKPVPRPLLADIPRLVAAYYTHRPDPSDPAQRVAFGTSGHRGSSLTNSFNEEHILAICRAICEHRKARRISGPLFLGMDTHALSEAAFRTAVEVFASHGVVTMIQQGRRYTPTPVISHAILTYNRGRRRGLADGVVITPSHNPPEDGGFKYNPPEGGPADPATTRAIEIRANELLVSGARRIRRLPFEHALASDTVHPHDYVTPYVADLEAVIDMEAIRRAGLKIGADPLGGATLDFWDPIAARYGLAIDVVNRTVDPTFAFMTLDWDGRIRMDCSSPDAMQGLIALKDRFDVAFGNDPDGDRHGIVTRGQGLMNPNHVLAAAVWYLFRHRPGWSPQAAAGKTLVSTAMIDRVAAALDRPLYETPVGFKWFVGGLLDGSCGFGGEESAGASFLRTDGTVWTTDKDGIVMDLLACEITARTGLDPSSLYAEIEARFGRCYTLRRDTAATPEQKAALAQLTAEQVRGDHLGGEPIRRILTRAPANGASIGGIKVVTDHGWFAARPSGTEEIYKIYAESFIGEGHLQRIAEEAVTLVREAFAAAGL
jgi:phosphoglucomutase